MPLYGNDTIRESQILPEPVTEENFAALKAHSPFLRSVGFSHSIILTGTARFDNEVFAILLNTGTTESHLVSKTTNHQGWQLVELRGDEDDLESLTAIIKIAGGEVISIRYEKLPPKPTNSNKGKPGSSRGNSTKLSSSQMNEAKYAALNYRKGFSSDGYPKEPPPEMVQKLSKMSSQQRESINTQMIELRNSGLGMKERLKIYVDKVDRSLQGRR